MAITISDIAKEAGVSKATVSRVLSGSSSVRPEVRSRIQEIIDRHGYIPNRFAQSLAGNSKKVIGLVIEELTNDFYLEIADSFDRIVSASGYTLNLASSRWSEEYELRIVRDMISSQVEGIVIAPTREDSPGIKLLKKSGVKFIIMNLKPENSDLPYVCSDNRAGGEIAARCINTLGRKINLLVTGYQNSTLEDRIQGFRESYNLSVPFFHYRDINLMGDGAELAENLIHIHDFKKEAGSIFVTNDNAAIGLESGFLKLGIRIPEELAILGYDNTSRSSICRVPLTTVSQELPAYGRVLAYKLMNLIELDSCDLPGISLPPKIVLRESMPLPAGTFTDELLAAD